MPAYADISINVVELSSLKLTRQDGKIVWVSVNIKFCYSTVISWLSKGCVTLSFKLLFVLLALTKQMIPITFIELILQ